MSVPQSDCNRLFGAIDIDRPDIRRPLLRQINDFTRLLQINVLFQRPFERIATVRIGWLRCNRGRSLPNGDVSTARGGHQKRAIDGKYQFEHAFGTVRVGSIDLKGFESVLGAGQIQQLDRTLVKSNCSHIAQRRHHERSTLCRLTLVVLQPEDDLPQRFAFRSDRPLVKRPSDVDGQDGFSIGCKVRCMDLTFGLEAIEFVDMLQFRPHGSIINQAIAERLDSRFQVGNSRVLRRKTRNS